VGVGVEVGETVAVDMGRSVQVGLGVSVMVGEVVLVEVVEGVVVMVGGLGVEVGVVDGGDGSAIRNARKMRAKVMNNKMKAISRG
jgi:hypothetical protein